MLSKSAAVALDDETLIAIPIFAADVHSHGKARVPVGSITITGAIAGQPIPDDATTHPFAGVVVSSTSTGSESVKINLLDSSGRATDANGTLTGAGLIKIGVGSYTLTSGNSMFVTSELEGLVFTPTSHEVAPGQSISTSMNISVTVGSKTVTNSGVSVVASAANDGAVISGTVSGQTTLDTTAVHPFANVKITTIDTGVTDSMTVTLHDGNGLATDANGALSGTGLSKIGVGIYRLSGTPSTLTTELDGLLFTPTTHEVAPGLTVVTAFGLAVTQGSIVTTDSNTAVLVTATSAPANPVVAAEWSGLTSAVSGGFYPPDNAIAVGLSNVVTAENDAIQWSNLQGSNVFQERLETLFSSVMAPNSFLTDPRLAYDSTNQRFVLSIDDVSNTLSTSHVLLAVTKDANPADGWFFESVNTSYILNSHQTWSDYPMLAVDGSHIYLSSNQFTPGNNGTFAGNAVTVLADSGLYSGGVSSPQSFSLGNALYQVAADPNGGSFYVDYGDFGTNTLSVIHSVGPTAFTSRASINLGAVDVGGFNYAAAEPNSTAKLDAGDGRVESAVVAKGVLYAVFEVQPSTGSAPALHWVELNVADPAHPSLIAQGNVLGSSISSGATAFNGSIAVDGNGDVLINFNASGPNLLPGDYFVMHRAGDPQGAFTAPTLYQASATSYQDAGHDSISRWGDYSTATADPAHANAFWISNEYATGPNTWGTAIAEVVQPTGVAVAQQPSVSLLG